VEVQMGLADYYHAFSTYEDAAVLAGAMIADFMAPDAPVNRLEILRGTATRARPG
jgi:hypothetical protein